MAGGSQRYHFKDQLLTRVYLQFQNPNGTEERHLHCDLAEAGFSGCDLKAVGMIV